MLVKYNLPGRPVYHERIVTGIAEDADWYSQATNDGDHYMECYNVMRNPDIDDVRLLRHRGEVPPGVRPDQIYHFATVLSAAQRAALMRSGAQLVAEHDAAHPRGAAAAGGLAPPPAGAAGHAGGGAAAGVAAVGRPSGTNRACPSAVSGSLARTAEAWSGGGSSQLSPPVPWAWETVL